MRQSQPRGGEADRSSAENKSLAVTRGGSFLSGRSFLSRPGIAPAISGVNDETERSAANFEQRGSATLTPGNLGGRAVRACAPRAKNYFYFPENIITIRPAARPQLRERNAE